MIENKTKEKKKEVTYELTEEQKWELLNEKMRYWFDDLGSLRESR